MIMEVRARAKSVRVSPRKMRLVVDAVRNLSIDEAFRVLSAAEQKAATPIMKVLQSAIANAVNNAQLDRNSLKIGSIQVTEGQAFKRFRPSTRGRVHPYKKRGSIITVVVAEKQNYQAAPTVVADDKKVDSIQEATIVEDKGGKK
jgi:large subunit ribosomal protein L22